MFHEPKCQPIEQFGMARQAAHMPEVVRRFHNPPAEMVLPNTIYDRTPGQQIMTPGEPMSQGGPPRSLIGLSLLFEQAGGFGEDGRRAGNGWFLWPLDVSAREHIDRTDRLGRL